MESAMAVLRRLTPYWAFFLLLPCFSSEALAEKELRYQKLYFAMGGHEVGWTESKDVQTKTGYRFERTTYIKLNRGAVVVEMNTSSVAHTDRNLRPVDFRYEKRDAAGLFVIEGRAKGNTLSLATTSAGATVNNVLEMPKELTFASATDLWVRQNLKSKGHLERPVLVEEMGAVTPMTFYVEKLKNGHHQITATLAGMQMTEEIDAKGYTVIARTPALGAVAYPVGLPPPEGTSPGSIDMMARSTWPAPRLSKSIPKVYYRVHTPDAHQFAVPTDQRQTLLNRTDTYLDLMVNSASSTKGGLSAKERKEYTKETPYEAISDPRIRHVAKAQIKGAKTTREKVKRLNDFVYQHVQAKSLDRGYAPATATLESRAGDCTEHSVLLSALLRSVGIPTRLVDGVVVDGGRAGYHEWVEVQIDQEGFVPADPTFGEFPASPLRLKLAEGSSSPEGLLGLGVAAGRMLRPEVRIEVLSSSPR
jgi:transglutaminase-like putative cysteine protease